MNIRCPYCGVEYELDRTTYGRKANCGACGKDFIIGQSPVQGDASKETRRSPRPEHLTSETKQQQPSIVDVLTYGKTLIGLLFKMLIWGAVTFAGIKMTSCACTVRNDIIRKEEAIAARAPVTKLFGFELGSRVEPSPGTEDKVYDLQKEVAISKPFFGMSSVHVWLTPISHKVYKIGIDMEYMVISRKFSSDLFLVPTQEAVVQNLIDRYGENDRDSDVAYRHRAGDTELVFLADTYDHRERTALLPEAYRGASALEDRYMMEMFGSTIMHKVEMYLVDHALERVRNRELEELKKRDDRLKKEKVKEEAAAMRGQLPL